MAQSPAVPTTPEPAGPGKHVIIDLETNEGRERLEFDIVPDEYADFKKGFLGEGTPLAATIRGLVAGQSAEYRTGDARRVWVLAVMDAEEPPSEEIARRREETYRKAVEQSDRTNAMIFASSFSGKWGDYDPTGFTEEIQPGGESQDHLNKKKS